MSVDESVSGMEFGMTTLAGVDLRGNGSLFVVVVSLLIGRVVVFLVYTIRDVEPSTRINEHIHNTSNIQPTPPFPLSMPPSVRFYS